MDGEMQNKRQKIDILIRFQRRKQTRYCYNLLKFNSLLLVVWYLHRPVSEWSALQQCKEEYDTALQIKISNAHQSISTPGHVVVHP
jgi:hypothetical protein